MPLSRRTGLLLLAVIACSSLALRFPSAPHEVGADNFLWHGMAFSIQSTEYASWILSPLSYLGLYPLSHPSGAPFLIVAVSDLSGFPLEGAVLFLDFAVGLLCALVAFVLGWEFSRNHGVALLVSTVLTTTPEMLTGLTWQVPTRLMFTILMILMVWTLIRLARHANWRTGSVAAVVFLLMSTFHRLTVLVGLVAIAFVLTGILLTITRTLRRNSPSLFLRAALTRRLPYMSIFAWLGIAGGTLFVSDVLSQYSVGALASGNSVQIELFNLGVSLARGSGLLLPFSLVGVVAVAFGRNKSFHEPFLLVSYLAFVPMLFLRQYTSYYTLPFTTLFIAIGLISVIRRIRSTHLRLMVIGTTVSFLVVTSIAISAYDLRLTTGLSDTTYSTALYVRDSTSGTIIANDGLMGSRIYAFSSVPYLPIGGATTSFQGPELLIFGFLTPEQAQANITYTPLGQLTVDSDSTFFLKNVQAEADWVAILGSPIDAVPARYSLYHLSYALESKSLIGSFTAYGNTYPSSFFATAHTDRYIIYSTPESSIYFLGGQ